MDQAIDNPTFMKSLISCYKLKRRARKQVFQNKIFYRELVKVQRWKQQVKQQVLLASQLNQCPKQDANLNHPQIHQSHQEVPQELLLPSYDYSDSAIIKNDGEQEQPEGKEDEESGQMREPIIKLEPRISFQESQPQLQFEPSPPPPPPSTSLSSNSMSSFTDTAATVISGSTPFYTPPTSAGSVSNGSSSNHSVGSSCRSNSGCGSVNSGASGSGCGGGGSGSSSISSNPNSYSTSESTGSSCSIQSCDTSNSPPVPRSKSTHRKSSKQQRQYSGQAHIEEVADVDILRRNLWLMIVRREIPHAYRRKTSSREQKLVKTKSIAQRCVSHIAAFRKRNGHSNSLALGGKATTVHCLPANQRQGTRVELQFHVNRKLTC